MTTKIKVAVFFGAKSPEHDVSIITALQVIKALDPEQFIAIPVYITPTGAWLTGRELLDPNNYMLSQNTMKKLAKVTLDLNEQSNSKPKGKLLLTSKGMNNFFKLHSLELEFDIALLALHGIHGEDGQVAAIMELANIPYTGMRHLAGTLLMNKVITKQLLHKVGIPVLPHKVIPRPTSGFIVEHKVLTAMLDGMLDFPLCVKPCNLGSSIGVAKVSNLAELAAVLPSIFKYDQLAMVEPFVENLVEYNIAVGTIAGKVVTSAIEQPKCEQDLLDFKQKYFGNNSNNTSGVKMFGKNLTPTTGMLAMTRILNPNLDHQMEKNIKTWAELAFNTVYGSGFPRIDFLSNSKTGEIWLNEINPCPGSLGYYLWEASSYNLLFTELLNKLLEEAWYLYKRHQLPLDPTPQEARLFARCS